MKIISRLKFGLPAITIATGIFIISNQPYLDLPKLGIDYFDKILHAGAYFVLGVSVYYGLKLNHPEISGFKLFLLMFLIGGGYGMTDEIHQSFVPGRSADVMDWAADATGIGFSFLVVILISKFRTRHKKRVAKI